MSDQMIFFFVAAGLAVGFFLASLFLLNLGRRLGVRHLSREGAGAMAGLNAIEGSVFALLGLLLAFAMSVRYKDSTSVGN
jgi:hypothetical protein